MCEITPINEKARNKIVNFIEENWGSTIIVTKGKIHSADKLKGYVFIVNDKIKGLISYCIENNECEIVSLDSLIEHQGIGTNLIDKVIEIAKEHNCKRIWLVTTNDNTKAIRYYQKKGFNIKNIYINSVQESRKIKPEIPLYGFDDIPILHEIEFEIILS